MGGGGAEVYVEASLKKCPPTLYHFNCHEECVLMTTEKNMLKFNFYC